MARKDLDQGELDRQKLARQKWDKVYTEINDEAPQPCWVLAEFACLLPKSGAAVDVASGRGGNALFLADAGLQTTAIDISPVGLDCLKLFAEQRRLKVKTRTEALSTECLGINRWDVIVVSNFLQRDLFVGLENALTPGGLLYYETFVKNKCDQNSGPGNTQFLLDDNELIEVFPTLSVRAFFDLQVTGDHQFGLRNRSCLVAQKID